MPSDQAEPRIEVGIDQLEGEHRSGSGAGVRADAGDVAGTIQPGHALNGRSVDLIECECGVVFFDFSLAIRHATFESDADRHFDTVDVFLPAGRDADHSPDTCSICRAIAGEH